MNQPNYYLASGQRQVFDFIESFGLGFNLGNVAKYIARCGKKGTKQDAIEDLRKAISYLEREIYLREHDATDERNRNLEAFARREQGG